jgi:hypothetical protein
MSDKLDFSDDKIQYLTLIQGIIGRMATMSSVFKGLAITVFVGVTALLFSLEIQPAWWISAIVYCPILICLVLDAYYLYLEKLYRWLFNEVRLENHGVDFDLSKPTPKETKNDVSVSEIIKSVSIWLFYLMLLLSAIAIVLYFVLSKQC